MEAAGEADEFLSSHCAHLCRSCKRRVEVHHSGPLGGEGDGRDDQGVYLGEKWEANVRRSVMMKGRPQGI